MEALNEILARIQPIFRGKDARVSHERRMMALAALKEDDLQKSLAFISQAVLRAPMTGSYNFFSTIYMKELKSFHMLYLLIITKYLF